MKKAVFIWLILVSGVISNNVYCQKDTLGIHKFGSSDVGFEFGGGICLSGFIAEISNTYDLSDDWGISISFRINFMQAKNLPDDFYETNINLITPHDYINALSLKLFKESTDNHKKLTFGVEGGPAWILYRKINFTINPEYYGPPYGWDFINKYLKSKTFNNTVGLSLRVRLQYNLMEGLGIGTALFININEFEPIVGLEFYTTFTIVEGD